MLIVAMITCLGTALALQLYKRIRCALYCAEYRLGGIWVSGYSLEDKDTYPNWFAYIVNVEILRYDSSCLNHEGCDVCGLRGPPISRTLV